MKYLTVVAGYLLGSLPFGYVVTKYWKGINILEYGSGNIGFTNVLRTVGWRPALLVLACDVGKGAVAAWLGLRGGGELPGIMAGSAALLGHSYSLFLRFRGGKLVAAGLGVLLVLAPRVALVAVTVWLVAVLVSRFVSLASVLAALSLYPAMIIFNVTVTMKVFLAIAGAFVIYRHRTNISRLLKGQEYKIGQKVPRK